MDLNYCITASGAIKLLCAKFEGLSVTGSTVRNHTVNHCKLSLKNITPYNLERNSDRTIRLRHDFVSAWKTAGVNYMENCVFVDEAGFNSHQIRTRGWSKIEVIPRLPRYQNTEATIYLLLRAHLLGES